MNASFLVKKPFKENLTYTDTEAFFLGSLLMCCDEHSEGEFVSLVRHNKGYVSPEVY